ncbi:MAG: OmpA family protein [Gemmatimonadota bacterium]|nr:MAG: OmpA family protein [Gemmatimonadota bacterium]
MIFEIGGYTDDTGPDDLNVRLSFARANAVKWYLVGRGVSPDRLAAWGYGPADPAAGNATAEGRARNRRVELRRLH